MRDSPPSPPSSVWCRWYPAPTEMWRNESRIVSNGNFVMLVAHTGADAVVEQFNALFA